MKQILSFLKNRNNFLYFLSTLIIFLFMYQIAYLTLAQGAYYRELSDSKRIREVKISPFRGEIKDRYGRILAGNETSFTVKLLKDEIPKNEKNDISLLLSMILEEEGENYTDEFPILLNRIYFKDKNSKEFQNQDPEDVVVARILETEILKEIVHYYKIYSDGNNQFVYHVGNRLLNKVYRREPDCPILLQKVKNEWVYRYKNEDLEERNIWLRENDIDERLSAEDAFLEYLKQNLVFVRGLYADPIASQFIFDKLYQMGKAQDLYLQPFSYTYDETYREIKDKLQARYTEVTEESTAKEDFVNIAKETILPQLVEKSYHYEDEEGQDQKLDIIGLLVQKLEAQNVSVPVDYAEDEKERINFFKKENFDLEYYYNKYGDGSPISNKEIFISLLKENISVLQEVLVTDEIKLIVQKLLIEEGMNTQISVANWEYIPLVQKNTWLKGYNCESIIFASEVFEKLRKQYKIEDHLTPFEARLIMNMQSVLLKQGYRGYEPVRIAFDVTEKTVSKIKENQTGLKGIFVDVESIRTYPYGETAAHLLGYMGRISQSFEIEKYVEQQGYSPDDLIGKTGVEEKFESFLRGIDGYRILEVDVFGNTIEVKEEKEAVKGNTVYLTLDAKLQKTAEECLAEALEQIREKGIYKSRWGDYTYKDPFPQANSGALVAVSVKTGEILAMANIPSYDPNLFATGINNQDWKELNRNEASPNPLAPKPLYNIAMQTAIQPGSVFKMITSLAALELGFDPYMTVQTMGYIELGNRVFKCWIWPQGTHGSENMMHAIKDSCNYYFYTLVLGQNMRTNQSVGKQLGYQNILEMARKFGLDDPTGIEIDVPKEKSGGVPDPDLKKKMSQRGLQTYLKQNIEQFLMPDHFYTPDQIERMIEEISSWAMEEEIPTRNEVMRRLESLELIFDRAVNGKNLTDIIKYDYLNDSKWKIGDTLNIAIGQGQNAYTPLQMARYTAMLANGAYPIDLTILDHFEDESGQLYEVDKEESDKAPVVAEEDLQYVREGMLLVSEEGTARSVFRNFPIQVAAKTGSAQKDGINPDTGQKYDNYGWFVAYAPFDDPEIAVAAVAFQSGSGGVIGPAVRDVIAEYLGLNETVPQYFPQGNTDILNQ